MNARAPMRAARARMHACTYGLTRAHVHTQHTQHTQHIQHIQHTHTTHTLSVCLSRSHIHLHTHADTSTRAAGTHNTTQNTLLHTTQQTLSVCLSHTHAHAQAQVHEQLVEETLTWLWDLSAKWLAENSGGQGPPSPQGATLVLLTNLQVYA